MNRAGSGPEVGAPQGVRLTGETPAQRKRAGEALLERLRSLGLLRHCEWSEQTRSGHFGVRLLPAVAADWAPGFDTLPLARRLELDIHAERSDLEREIMIGLLLAPEPLGFPHEGEFESAVRIRRDTVLAARLTALAFDTDAIERPTDCWRYDEATGFTVRPGSPLIDALRRATQPDHTGRRYAFSCYRASEYVILLGIAQEAERVNPAFLARLQARVERRAVQSGEFHDAFLREYGSMEQPLPPRYYVPGDRVWFRNPDEHSADAMGFEGSWVTYLGDGRFSNFWEPSQPFTLTRKCLELFHWRHGTYRDAQGALRIDEAEVARRIDRSLQDPPEVERILRQMQRLREPRGVYRDGGCMDTSREFARFIHPSTLDMTLSAD
jgi:hypothetical protein